MKHGEGEFRAPDSSVYLRDFENILLGCITETLAVCQLDGAGLPNSAPFNEVQYASSVEARSVFFVLHFFSFSFRLSTFPPADQLIEFSGEVTLASDFTQPSGGFPFPDGVRD